MTNGIEDKCLMIVSDYACIQLNVTVSGICMVCPGIQDYKGVADISLPKILLQQEPSESCDSEGDDI